MSGRIDVEALKRAAASRWPEILSALGGMPAEILDGKHHPCPKCGGTDRFRAFTDGTGGVYCNQCFRTSNGDGIATLTWRNGSDFATEAARIAEFLGIYGTNGRSHETNGHEKEKSNGKKKIVETYSYRDEKNELLFQVVRFEPKEFRQRRPDPAEKNRWIWKVKGVRVVPYMLPQIVAAPGQPIAVVEGEKDVQNLARIGILATCNAGGAGKWTAEHAQFLHGRIVVILPDNDDKGRQHAQQVAQSLDGIAKQIFIVELPGLPEKGDVSDWLTAGGTREQLRELAKATREWAPPDDSGTPAEITNTETELDEDGNDKHIPLAMYEVLKRIQRATGNWPRRVGDSLFVLEGENINWLNSAASLFGWLATFSRQRIFWHRFVGCVSREEVYAEIQRTSQSYDAIATLPHEPAIPGHFYACGEIQPGDGAALNWLLNRFAPATPIDRDLLLAAIVTPLWGGPVGARPCFLLTSEHGRGVGKSKTTQMLTRIWGGAIDVSQNEEIAKLKTRLLSGSALAQRIALLDNIKSLRFSWAELEALITSATISGHQMYKGEGSRPNVLTWFLTLNGASLSTDMAQRCVIIKVDRPTYSDSWEGDTERFIEENRARIIADCVAFFRGPRFQLAKFSRWGAWEKDVLQRLPEPVEAQRVILDRQAIVDVEADDAALLEEFFQEQLAKLTYKPDTDQVFIPTQIAARWFNWANNDKQKAGAVSRIIGQLIDERRLTKVKRNACKSWGRGFVWVGEASDLRNSIKLDIETRLMEITREKDRQHTSRYQWGT